MSATAAVQPAGAFVRGAATWYSWLLTGAYIYLINVQGNVIPFLQDAFDLSYRAVSLHSSAIAAGIILVGLFGERVVRRIGRRRTLWLAVGGLAAGGILLCLSPGPAASIIKPMMLLPFTCSSSFSTNTSALYLFVIRTIIAAGRA